MNRLLALAPLGVLLVFLASLFCLPLWGLIDAARRPEIAYQRAGHSRTFWLAGIGGGMVLGLLPGVVFSIAYLVAVRPRLAAMAEPPSPDEVARLREAKREPARVRRRRRWLLIASGAFALLMFVTQPVRDESNESCRAPVLAWRGSESQECRDLEKEQLISGATMLAVTVGASLLATRVPTSQRFRGVFVQLAIGALLTVSAISDTVTGNPAWLVRVLAFIVGAGLVVRSVRLVPARRSVQHVA